MNIPRWAFDAAVEFTKLARGRKDDVDASVTAYLADNHEAPADTDAQSIARLAGLARVVNQCWPNKEATAEARFVKGPELDGLQAIKIDLLAYPFDKDEIDGALRRVKELWESAESGTCTTMCEQVHGCLTVFEDFKKVMCHGTPYDLTDATQARELLRFLCAKKARSQDTARKKAEILKALKTAGGTKANDWRPAHVFRGKLAALYRDAIGRNKTKGLYWINP